MFLLLPLLQDDSDLLHPHQESLPPPAVEPGNLSLTGRDSEGQAACPAPLLPGQVMPVCHTLEARNLVLASPPSPNLLLNKFKTIWGQEAFCGGGRVVGRGKFSLLYVCTAYWLALGGHGEAAGAAEGEGGGVAVACLAAICAAPQVGGHGGGGGDHNLSMLLQVLSLVPDSKL